MVHKSRKVSVLEGIDGVKAVSASFHVHVKKVSSFNPGTSGTLSDELTNVLKNEGSFGDVRTSSDTPATVSGLEKAQRNFASALRHSIDTFTATLAQVTALDDLLSCLQPQHSSTFFVDLVRKRLIFQLRTAFR
jgi:hypothetical protein